MSRRTSSLFIRSKIQFFESKSQPFEISRTFACSCLSDQRYNFLKANHNYSIPRFPPQQVIYQIKDTIFWKQITTYLIKSSCHALLFIRSKIQFFESKSQQTLCHACHVQGCLSDQRYNFLKANHNIGGVMLATKKARCKPRFKCFHNGIILIVICFKNCTANILHLFQNKSFFS